MSATTVTVYELPGCQACRLTIRAFARHGVQVEVIDLCSSPEAQQIVEAMDFTSAPVVAAGDRWWQGLRPDLIKQAASVAGCR
jgi:glutaredoxin